MKPGLKFISAEKCLLLAHVDVNGICPDCSGKFFAGKKLSLAGETYSSFLFNWGEFNWGCLPN